MYRCAITPPRVTRTGTYGRGRAPYRGCIGLRLILYSIHNTETDRRCARSHANTHQVKKLVPLTTRSSSLRCVSAAEHQTAEQYSKNWQNKTPKASPKKQSIMEYLPRLPQDTKPLRSCSGNRAKMLLKSHFGIKCHTQYNTVIRYTITRSPRYTSLSATGILTHDT